MGSTLPGMELLEPEPESDEEPRPSEARRFEAFGRVMAALSPDILESCRDFAWWEGDRGWHIEWRDGPYASEVAAGIGFLEVGPSTAALAELDVQGVRVMLRAVDPIGLERLRARPGVWRLSESFHAVAKSRRSSSRHHWEQLLGG